MSLQTFHELHVVSDLHLGGKPGFQIFSQGKTLASLVRYLARPSDREIGLVLNGDIVDFLAEAPAAYLDPKGAIDKLQRIFYEDEAFSDVWSALQEFVAVPNRELVLVLGNHDVELALPHVTEWMREKLSKGDSAARGRITTCFDGAGFGCLVGKKRVFCIHGNDVDLWNRVDYRQLLDQSIAINSGQTPGEWDPNPGTRLVIDVMNEIKRNYPIVDLLKPEDEVVAPTLLTLDRRQLRAITKILTVVAHLAKDVGRKTIGFLSAEQEMAESPISEEEVMSKFLGDHFEYGAGEAMDAEDLINSAYDEMEGGGAGEPTIQPVEDVEFLGPLDYLPAILGSEKSKVDKLRKALKKNLERDHTFKLTHKDDLFKQMDTKMGTEVNYVITGHKHLERAIERSAPDCYYFNSGTWIRLIQLTEEVLGNSEEFARVYAAFKSGSMAELDGINNLGPSADQPLVVLRPTVVSVVEKDGETYGELCHAQPDGSLEPVEDTQLPRR